MIVIEIMVASFFHLIAFWVRIPKLIFRQAAWISLVLVSLRSAGADPLHSQVDAVMDAVRTGPSFVPVDDFGFLRRATLTLTGMPPTPSEVRVFTKDTELDKRSRLIAKLTAKPEFMQHLAVQLDVLLMERRAEMHTKAADWRRWLEDALTAGKSWDQVVREILAADGSDEKTRHLARWILERQAEPNLLARDAGRLFLGCDRACAQCHDHPRIDDYSQRDYHGLAAFFGRTYLFQPDPAKPGVVGEQAKGETSWTSVFTKVSGRSRPQLASGCPIDEPVIAEAALWKVAPNDKDKSIRPIPEYSRRGRLADVLLADPAYRKNMANRMWGMVMGRCLVEPPDLMHSGNPPAHPAVLQVIADGLATMNFQLRPFVEELALTKTFAATFDPLPPSSPDCEALTARLPELESLATQCKENSQKLDVAFTECVDVYEAEFHAAKAILDDWSKAITACAEAATAAEKSSLEVKTADDLAVSLTESERLLRDAATSGNVAAKASPNDKELAAAAKTFQDRLDKTIADLSTAAKEISSKKAAAGTARIAAESARVAAEAKKPAADEASSKLAAVENKRDTADNLKQTARVAAHQAEQKVRETNALLAYARECKAAVGVACEGPPVRMALQESKQALATVSTSTFAVASLAPIAPEQLCWSILQVTGTMDQLREISAREWDEKNPLSDADRTDPAKQAARASAIDRLLRDKIKPHEDQFVRLFANSAGQPQSDFFATADQVLYYENASSVRSWTNPSGNNLAARLLKLTDSKLLTEELFVSVLSRPPTDDDLQDITSLIESRPVEQRASAVSDAIWALLTSSEFRFRH